MTANDARNTTTGYGAPRRALVTGASHGLGLDTARRLAADGWSVTGVGRRPATAVEQPVPFDYQSANLSLPGTYPEVAGAPNGGWDLVVHSAVHYADFHHRPRLGFADTEEMLRVNALAPYYLTLEILDQQPADRFCSVVVVNSEAMYHADRHSAPYAASKAALRLLTAGLAESCRERQAAVSTLVLGPLDDERKRADLRAIAGKLGAREEEVTRKFLKRSNPDLVIEELIDYTSCFHSIRHLQNLGRRANGMVCRLDGGSAGSLI
ncbi:SDR family NAD(P)-dependent oxidoreductase [Streptomyces europaeiscabiei]|uniref:SDR family NAD(P)-dependent oxidoreductase n=1 Tax=Streptomyces europaeiscabiei TaxID=146819 RepID=UPI0029AC5646|nr:SDR family oxidoreductase [Streptomyces europaeiscabiei]MDX2757252.1 SDR family NAD(P)-dependent oxidoreductase [Streptomyces europaeiscabiei]